MVEGLTGWPVCGASSLSHPTSAGEANSVLDWIRIPTCHPLTSSSSSRSSRCISPRCLKLPIHTGFLSCFLQSASRSSFCG
ncbi:hypothetical protein M438DRAFT_144561 [Aureobasidium pullulans EXF-150]|uniref:Uncharacterized protein n=1 Tax=Aureobasidium pullulans EXF-150 TaxID=1043002 RepID=A0A074X2S3_AURPU|nr:uncharacterized protein M438DRAFT_144561 [Aureobasidium pullulans EXF-150]KEQ79668.1 hypothetical protein M438DRAFT_144561 [Aureobasidium pullulans EXF-150]